MTGHFRITGNTWATANLTVDDEPFPYPIEDISWKINRNGLPVLMIGIIPEQLTIETTNPFTGPELTSD